MLPLNRREAIRQDSLPMQKITSILGEYEISKLLAACVSLKRPPLHLSSGCAWSHGKMRPKTLYVCVSLYLRVRAVRLNRCGWGSGVANRSGNSKPIPHQPPPFQQSPSSHHLQALPNSAPKFMVFFNFNSTTSGAPLPSSSSSSSSSSSPPSRARAGDETTLCPFGLARMLG